MSAFLKSLSSVAKIAVVFVLVWFIYLLFFVKNQAEFYFGIALLVFVTLPTVFVMYSKTNKIFTTFFTKS